MEQPLGTTKPCRRAEINCSTFEVNRERPSTTRKNSSSLSCWCQWNPPEPRPATPPSHLPGTASGYTNHSCKLRRATECQSAPGGRSARSTDRVRRLTGLWLHNLPCLVFDLRSPAYICGYGPMNYEVSEPILNSPFEKQQAKLINRLRSPPGKLRP